MIPGGWFCTRGMQHWRRHGLGEPACGAKPACVDKGSLLPHEGVVACPRCMQFFTAEARIALPKYRRIVAALEKLV